MLLIRRYLCTVRTAGSSRTARRWRCRLLHRRSLLPPCTRSLQNEPKRARLRHRQSRVRFRYQNFSSISHTHHFHSKFSKNSATLHASIKCLLFSGYRSDSDGLTVAHFRLTRPRRRDAERDAHSRHHPQHRARSLRDNETKLRLGGGGRAGDPFNGSIQHVVRQTEPIGLFN